MSALKTCVVPNIHPRPWFNFHLFPFKKLSRITPFYLYGIKAKEEKFSAWAVWCGQREKKIWKKGRFWLIRNRNWIENGKRNLINWKMFSSEETKVGEKCKISENPSLLLHPPLKIHKTFRSESNFNFPKIFFFPLSLEAICKNVSWRLGKGWKS